MARIIGPATAAAAAPRTAAIVAAVVARSRPAVIATAVPVSATAAAGRRLPRALVVATPGTPPRVGGPPPPCYASGAHSASHCTGSTGLGDGLGAVVYSAAADGAASRSENDGARVPLYPRVVSVDGGS